MERQQRGRERREAILRAALALLVEGGPRVVTHRSVARRAGVPLAATTYYFASLDELLGEAMQLVVEERLAELAEVEQSQELDLPYLRAVLDRPSHQVIAQHELFLEAARNEPLRPGAVSAIESFEVVAGRMVSRFGDSDSRRARVALTALVDGLALHRIVRPLPKEEELEIFRDAVRALIIAFMADADEIAGWRERVQERLQTAQPEDGLVR